MTLLGTACGKNKEEQMEKNTNIQADEDEGTGWITAEGLAFEVTENIDRHTMSVFAIADYDKIEFTIPSEVEYDGEKYQVTAIGKSAFENEITLKKVEIPEGVESIGESAFYDCSNLTEVIIPESVTIIKDYAFGECINLKEIILPKNITEIGIETFTHCNALKEFTVPGSVTVLGNAAFYECESLESIVFGEGITALPQELFTNCTALKKVTLPKTLLSIGVEAFWSCDKLTQLEIPENVTGLGERCFYTSGLEKLVVYSSQIHPAEEIFDGAEIKEVLVPKGNKEKFQEFFADTEVKVGSVEK